MDEIYKLLIDLNGKVESQGARLDNAVQLLEEQGRKIDSLQKSAWRTKGAIASCSIIFGVLGSLLSGLTGLHR
jgi:hypothetical protein